MPHDYPNRERRAQRIGWGQRKGEKAVTTMDIEPELYRPQLEALLQAVGVTPTSACIKERNPDRAGMAAVRRDDGMRIILLHRRITPEMQGSILAAMEIRGFADEIARLAEPGAFLEHLVLHEAAHHILPDASELDCDRWAFERLNGRIE
jgi:hypothetical protein